MKKKWIAELFVVVSLVIVGIKLVIDYAAPPSKPKICNFVFPNSNKKTIQFAWPSLELDQVFGSINDASCLNQTPIYGVKVVRSMEDIRQSVVYAQQNSIPIIPAGQKHSMGGQAFVQNGLVLDMRQLNQMSLDKQNKILRTQTGATWADIQTFLDPEGLSVQAMQSINIFTVGGTLSVNAHGIAHNPGPIAPTVRSMQIMLWDGSLVTASPTENYELFRLALGGYGLFGVIVEVELDLVENELYDWKTEYMDYRDFPAFYRNTIENNPEIGLSYARLSVSPQSYLQETAIHTFTKNYSQVDIPSLKPDSHTWLNRLVINFSKTGGLGRWLRWNLEKYIQPKLSSCISRNQAMSQKEVCIVSRNQQMSNSMNYLKNRLQDTDILQEYFLEPEKMPEFVDGLRSIVRDRNSNLLNVTIRMVKKDTITALPYAKQDMLAFVLYFNQKLNPQQSEIVRQTTLDLIDLVNRLGGTYYLPYQLYYSDEQLQEAYPEIEVFFEAKRRYDPQEIFQNEFYRKYGQVDG